MELENFNGNKEAAAILERFEIKIYEYFYVIFIVSF
jgi:hypothetical protein